MTVLSLFDYSGRWATPYSEAGHDVICVDVKDSGLPYAIECDIREFCCDWLMENVLQDYGMIDGILVALPCTHLAGSGARWWSKKDALGLTAEAVELAWQVLRTVEFLRPFFWVLENPVGRLNRLVPALAAFGPWYFQPFWYGDPYTKKTGLWGQFNRDLPRNDVEPREGSKMWARYGGKSERTKELRSTTPEGFARAFYLANSAVPEVDDYDDDEPETWIVA